MIWHITNQGSALSTNYNLTLSIAKSYLVQYIGK